ncbi:hypothetical protein Y032_0417g1093 [Ancylostoma ceylanicum]|uniref:Uncharacterized protein n=1 Tax=Ancylostoma ceylanicum TaxID=53326 RepID=A0A016X3B7_9BILA|nr:hypothetical protein Y032_0417g1093 [Ancylostoma ceylanicum]
MIDVQDIAVGVVNSAPSRSATPALSSGGIPLNGSNRVKSVRNCRDFWKWVQCKDVSVSENGGMPADGTV